MEQYFWYCVQVAVSFEVNISAIGHHFEPSYIADFIYDASGAYGLHIRHVD